MLILGGLLAAMVAVGIVFVWGCLVASARQEAELLARELEYQAWVQAGKNGRPLRKEETHA